MIAFHAHIPGLGGGFIGVDVFFVISGFLITRNLVHEVETTGRVALATFWGKRLRRLVPALGLVVATTLVASVVVLPLFQLGDTARQGTAAALYLSNFLFAWESEDYFANDVGESPFLHTWSLGVEEQFYVIWPIVFAVAVLLARRRPERIRMLLGAGFVLGLVTSLAASVYFSPRNPSFAFYLLPTRAWQFAAAGLLALVVLPRWWASPWVRWTSATAGLGLVLYAALEFSATTVYPGLAAIVPVVGTVLLMTAGDPSPGGPSVLPQRLLALGPVQWLGRVSYSWYLWHWPAMILVVAAIGEDSARVRSGAAIASLALAHLTYRHYENPVRFSPWLTRSNGRTIAIAALATLLVVVLGGGVARIADSRASGDSLEARLARARGMVRPDECEQASTGGVVHCVGGDPDGEKTVLLTGDSHAGHWAGVMSAASAEEDLRFAYRWTGTCPTMDVYVTARNRTTMDERCTRHRAETRKLIEEMRPDLLVIASSSNYDGRLMRPDGSKPEPSEIAGLWSDAMEAFVAEMSALGVPVAVVIDTPSLVDDPFVCISRERATDPCVPDLARSLHHSDNIRVSERAVAERFGLVTLDINDDLCDDTSCALEVDGVLVYSDGSHLTPEYSMTQLPAVVEFLRAGLGNSQT